VGALHPALFTRRRRWLAHATVLLIATKMCYTHRPPQLGTYHVAFVIPCVLYIIVSFMPRLLYCVSSVCQVELAILVNVGVRVDSARASPLTGLVRSLRIGTVSLNSSLSLWTQQGCFAATVCPVWKQTASAVKLSAGNTEDSVAACAPAVRFVCVLLFSSCALASGMACLSKHAVSLVPLPRKRGTSRRHTLPNV